MTAGLSSRNRLEADADRAAARGDLSEAKRLLAEATTLEAGSIGLWLKRASIDRACGDPKAALEAVSRVLEIDPLEFTALVLKAVLLDQLGDPRAGLAAGHALAQRGQAPLPPPMAAALRRVEAVHSTHVAQLDVALARKSAPFQHSATVEERRRIARFSSNAARKTRVYHSEPVDFHFPGLVEREWYDPGSFPWIGDIERETDAIAGELAAVLSAERAELVPYVQHPRDVPLQQWAALNNNPAWTAIHLLRGGLSVDANAKHCPRTIELLRALPQPDVRGRSPNAMFSLLAPRAHIPPHTGVANTRLVCHLPLVVPEGGWIRVGAETRRWRRGEVMIFDDTIEHEAANESDALRIVLIFDIWHPHLTPIERKAAAAIMAADGDVGAL